jgi:high-affinity iron transporter
LLAALLITFREGLEAALIVGILLGTLRKIDRRGRAGHVWLGVGLAVLISVLLAWGFQRVGIELEGRGEEIFEAATMLLAVLILTWMIYWMRYQSHLLRSALERDVQRAVEADDHRGLAAVAFVAVFREGVETALFLSAATFASRGDAMLIGALVGIALAVVIGAGVYASTIHLSVRWFFNLTSVLLLLFAAGLLARGVHEFQEAGLLPSVVAEVWDINNILSEDSYVGALLKSLVGYNGNPSLEEVIAYLGYWLFALVGIRWLVEKSIAARQRAERAKSES